MPSFTVRLRLPLSLGVAACSLIACSDPVDDTPQIEVFVDAAGVPHIYAPDDASLFWAAGYVQAEARLAQMMMVRRRALGRQAELLGAGKVDEDELSRLMNFRDLGARDMERLEREHPEDFALIESWVAGVNAYIAELRAGEREPPVGLGPEGVDFIPEDWSPDDVGAIAKLLMFGNSNSLENEILTTVLTRFDAELFDKLEIARPAYPVYTLPAADVPGAAELGARPRRGRPSLPPAPEGIDPAEINAGLKRLHETLAEFSVEGSNNWAVAGAHTDNGRPRLANDPHQPLTSPAIIFALHMNSRDAGGSFDAAGFSFAGTPGVQLGHTGGVAWAATTGTADCMDLWSVSADAAAQTVQVGDESVAYTTRVETIEVAGGPARSLEVDEVPGYGIMLGDALLMDLGINEAFVAGVDRRLLLNWTGFDHGNELHAFFEMARAEGADDFEAAADQMEVGTFNWTFADASAIGYRSRILVPDRGDPASLVIPFLMLDGDDPSGYWSGAHLDDALLPRSRDPEQGFLLSANNDPYGFTDDGDLSNDPFYFGTFFLPGFRAQRADDELRAAIAAGPVTRAQMQALQLDNRVTEADLILPPLFDAWSQVGNDAELSAYEARPDLAALVQSLEAWDRNMDADSGEAIAFYAFSHELARASIGDEMSLVFDAVVNAAPAFPLKFSALTVTGGYPRAAELMDERVELVLLEALEATAAVLESNWPGQSLEELRWDQAHLTRFESSIDALTFGEVGTPGSVGTLNQSTSRYLDEDGNAASRFISKAGPMFRSVVEFDDAGRPHLFFTFAPGNGGSPEGGHWGDLLEDWVAGRYLEMPFAREEVEAAAAERRQLQLP